MSTAHPPASSAQRRPGRLPRRHATTPPRRSGARTAQRRPGRLPRGDTRKRCGVSSARRARSTKAGASAPATHASSWLRQPDSLPRSTKAGASAPATRSFEQVTVRGRISLNEGRGVCPGDTGPARLTARTANVAQRRPGRLPRRHRPVSGSNSTASPRSTKAGASAPATHAIAHSCGHQSPSAQRRPGRLPRRHPENVCE